MPSKKPPARARVGAKTSAKAGVKASKSTKRPRAKASAKPSAKQDSRSSAGGPLKGAATVKHRASAGSRKAAVTGKASGTTAARKGVRSRKAASQKAGSDSGSGSGSSSGSGSGSGSGSDVHYLRPSAQRTVDLSKALVVPSRKRLAEVTHNSVFGLAELDALARSLESLIRSQPNKVRPRKDWHIALATWLRCCEAVNFASESFARYLFCLFRGRSGHLHYHEFAAYAALLRPARSRLGACARLFDRSGAGLSAKGVADFFVAAGITKLRCDLMLPGLEPTDAVRETLGVSLLEPALASTRGTGSASVRTSAARARRASTGKKGKAARDRKPSARKRATGGHPSKNSDSGGSASGSSEVARASKRPPRRVVFGMTRRDAEPYLKRAAKFFALALERVDAQAAKAAPGPRGASRAGGKAAKSSTLASTARTLPVAAFARMRRARPLQPLMQFFDAISLALPESVRGTWPGAGSDSGSGSGSGSGTRARGRSSARASKRAGSSSASSSASSSSSSSSNTTRKRSSRASLAGSRVRDGSSSRGASVPRASAKRPKGSGSSSSAGLATPSSYGRNETSFVLDELSRPHGHRFRRHNSSSGTGTSAAAGSASSEVTAAASRHAVRVRARAFIGASSESYGASNNASGNAGSLRSRLQRAALGSERLYKLDRWASLSSSASSPRSSARAPSRVGEPTAFSSF